MQPERHNTRGNPILSLFLSLVIIGIIFFGGWWLFFGGTSARINHQEEMILSKGEIYAVPYGIISDYSEATVLEIKLESNDYRIQFSLIENGPREPSLTLSKEVGPKTETTFQYFIVTDPNLPHGTYSSSIEVSKGGIYRAHKETISVIVS